MTKIPNSERLDLPGGPVGLLLIPGFQSSHEPLTAWVHALHATGYTVVMPFLTPVAKRWKEIKHSTWRNWQSEVEDEFRRLKTRCEKVFVAGSESGGALALHLGEVLGDELAGLLLLQPSLPTIHKVSPRTWRGIELDLYLVDQPILLLSSSLDEAGAAESARQISSELSSPFIREVILEKSSIPSSTQNSRLLIEESVAFMSEIVSGVWLTDIGNDDDETDLIDAEFQSIVAGISLDDVVPTNYLDILDRIEAEDHFEIPDPELLPITDHAKRNAIVAMVLGPLYAIAAALTNFNPFGIEPWPGVLAFLGGVAVFLYRLRDDYPDDDGAVL